MMRGKRMKGFISVRLAKFESLHRKARRKPCFRLDLSA
jgi:hypothetical protein